MKKEGSGTCGFIDDNNNDGGGSKLLIGTKCIIGSVDIGSGDGGSVLLVLSFKILLNVGMETLEILSKNLDHIVESSITSLNALSANIKDKAALASSVARQQILSCVALTNKLLRCIERLMHMGKYLCFCSFNMVSSKSHCCVFMQDAIKFI